MTTQECTKCKETKLLTDFYEDKSNKNGFKGSCKICYREYYKNTIMSRYYSDPEFRQSIIDANKLYQKTNPKAILYNRAKARHRVSSYRAGVAKFGAAVSDFYANCPTGMSVDHIIPLSRGGKTEPNNLQYLTLEQNMRKGAKLDYATTDDLPR